MDRPGRLTALLVAANILVAASWVTCYWNDIAGSAHCELIFIGIALAWSAVSYRFRLAAGRWAAVVSYGLLGPVTVAISILVTRALVALALTSIMFFPASVLFIAGCPVVAWIGFLICRLAALRIVRLLSVK